LSVPTFFIPQVTRMFRILAFLLVCSAQYDAHAQLPEPLPLRDAIRIALSRNPHVLAAAASVDGARGRRWRALSPPPPALSAEYNFIPNGRPLSASGERTIALSQTIEFPAAYPLRGMQQSALLREGESSLVSTRSAIATEVKVLYATVQALLLQRDLALENRALAEDFSKKTRVRADLGEGTELEALTARMLAMQSENGVENAMMDLSAARGALLTALGVPVSDRDAAFSLSDTMAYAPFPLRHAEVVDRVVQGAATIRAAESRASAASTALALAWTSLLPSFTATYAWQRQDGIPNLHGFAFGVSLPLWFAFDQRGQIEEAQAGRLAAAHEVDAVRNSVARDAAASLLELKKSERQVLLYRSDILPQALRVYSVAAASWEAGEISSLELLQARQALSAVKGAAIDALLDYQIAWARLEGLLDITGIE
jgi:outer membrane protein, heavy metal efflux system